jgi:hypothetical protein
MFATSVDRLWSMSVVRYMRIAETFESFLSRLVGHTFGTWHKTKFAVNSVELLQRCFQCGKEKQSDVLDLGFSRRCL